MTTLAVHSKQDGLGSDAQKESASVIGFIVNWNKRDLLREMIKSLDADVRGRMHVILVDNASTDGSVEMVRAEFPHVEVIQNEINLGGAGGFNTGIRAVWNRPYDYVWLMDNDIEVWPGAFDALLVALKKDPQIGLVGSKILHADDHSVICEIGSSINFWTAGTHPNQLNGMDPPAKKIWEADYVAACSAMARMSALHKVGLWDKNYFVMWDDMEWGCRFRKKGYRVCGIADSAISHPGFSERSRGVVALKYFGTRNRFFFIGKMYGGLQRIFYLMCLEGRKRAQAHYWSLVDKNLGTAIRRGMADFWALQMGPAPKDLAACLPPSSGEPIPCAVENKQLLISAWPPLGRSKKLLSELSDKNWGGQVSVVSDEMSRNLYRQFEGRAYFTSPSFWGHLKRWLWSKRQRTQVVVKFWDEPERFSHHAGKEIWVLNNELSISCKKEAKLFRALASECVLLVRGSFAFINGAARALYCSLFGKTFKILASEDIYQAQFPDKPGNG